MTARAGHNNIRFRFRFRPEFQDQLTLCRRYLARPRPLEVCLIRGLQPRRRLARVRDLTLIKRAGHLRVMTLLPVLLLLVLILLHDLRVMTGPLSSE